MPERPASKSAHHKTYKLHNWKALGQHKSPERKVVDREHGIRHYYSPQKVRNASVLEKTLDNTEMDFTMDPPPKVTGSVFAPKLINDKKFIQPYKRK